VKVTEDTFAGKHLLAIHRGERFHSFLSVSTFINLQPAKIRFDFGLSSVPCPVGRSSTPEHIFQIQSRAAFDKQSDHFKIARPGSVMQRRRMRMAADWVISVGIFARIQQQSNDFDVSKLRGQASARVAVVAVADGSNRRKSAMRPRAAAIGKSIGAPRRIKAFSASISPCKAAACRAIGNRSVIAEKIDQRELHSAFTRHAARRNQHQRLVQARLLNASLENDLRYLNDILRQSAVANGIFGNEFQQGRMWK
jgi:hypothetical protein